jgi:hypothetical protein
VSYYAAGGYYRAGGFFGNLFKGVSKFASFVTHTPIISSVVGLVPGLSTGLGLAGDIAGAVSASGAVAKSTAGTPGHQAALQSGAPVTLHRAARASRVRHMRVRRRRRGYA